MSLINDMLRDLDKRKAPEQEGNKGDSPLPIPAVPLRANPIYRWIFWLIAIIAVSFLAAFLFKIYTAYNDRLQQTFAEKKAAQAALQPELQSQAAAEMANGQTILPVENPRTRVQSIDIIEFDNDARIEIELSAAVDHKVIKKGDLELLIQLPNTELTQLLPSLAGHPLINAIDVASEKGNLQLSVSLARQTTFQTYLLNKETHALLVIELLAPKMAGTSIVDSGQVKPLPDVQPDESRRGSEEQTSKETIAGLSSGSGAVADVTETRPSVFAKTTREKSLAEKDREASQKALSSFRAGRAGEAIKQLNQMIDRYPQASLSRETLVVIYLKQQRYDEARRELAPALLISPDSSALIKLQARLLMANNAHDKALALLDRLKNENRDDQEYLSLLASLNQQQGEHVNAVNQYRDLLKMDPTQANWWIGQAISLEALGLQRDALQAYLQARRVPQIDARLKQYTEERIRALN